MKKINIFLFLRLVVSAVFLVSGTEKLLSPYENFLYVIENYQVLPFSWMEKAVAMVFPWFEVALGAFLLLGLWTKTALLGLAAMTFSFIVVVGQAIIRDLPIQSCGCFGDLVKVPLPVIIGMDSTILLCIFLMFRNFSRVLPFSLDGYFNRAQ